MNHLRDEAGVQPRIHQRAEHRHAGNGADLPAGVGGRCRHARTLGRNGGQDRGRDRYHGRADAGSGKREGHHQRQVVAAAG